VEKVCFWISYANAVRIAPTKRTSEMGPKFNKMLYVISALKNHTKGIPKIAIPTELAKKSR
jgi:hypothetical protein